MIVSVREVMHSAWYIRSRYDICHGLRLCQTGIGANALAGFVEKCPFRAVQCSCILHMLVQASQACHHTFCRVSPSLLPMISLLPVAYAALLPLLLRMLNTSSGHAILAKVLYGTGSCRAVLCHAVSCRLSVPACRRSLRSAKLTWRQRRRLW